MVQLLVLRSTTSSKNSDNVGETLELNKLSPLECGFLGDEYPTLKLVS
jgi:hypothetical protein